MDLYPLLLLLLLLLHCCPYSKAWLAAEVLDAEWYSAWSSIGRLVLLRCMR